MADRPIARCQGFTLIEVLVATVLIALFLIPAMQAMNTVTRTGGELQQQRERYQLLRAKADSVLALPFSGLAAVAGSRNAPGPLSDAVAQTPRRLVYITHYDGDATGTEDPFVDGETDADLLWIRVAFEDAGDDIVTMVRR